MNPTCAPRRRGLARLLPLATLVALLAAAPDAARAQPFGAWLVFSGNHSGTGNGFVQIPTSSALNPTDVLTIEGWVDIANPTVGCTSLIGKGYISTYWIGVCPQSGRLVLRSYLRGSGSLKDGGFVPIGQWTHFAVTFDGTTRRHYIDGELVASFLDPGALTTGSNPVEIGGDADYAFSPNGSVNELRFWHTARTVSQIRSTINVPITAPQPGLVAVWPLRTNGNDALGVHNGTLHGTIHPFSFPATLHCFGNATTACLADRFAVSVQFRTGGPGTATGTANVAPCGTADSGLFWFFDPANWEVLVKHVNGCGLNNERWIFSASTTNVFYRMTVVDVEGSGAKIYFNYGGPPAPAVTDTSAFATCP
jgi:Concanavalin A-like lectin/glucanases superfamily